MDVQINYLDSNVYSTAAPIHMMNGARSNGTVHCYWNVPLVRKFTGQSFLINEPGEIMIHWPASNFVKI
jgi:hypothetical protein